MFQRPLPLLHFIFKQKYDRSKKQTNKQKQNKTNRKTSEPIRLNVCFIPKTPLIFIHLRKLKISDTSIYPTHKIKLYERFRMMTS